MDSTIAGPMNDNINMNSTIAESMNDKHENKKIKANDDYDFC